MNSSRYIRTWMMGVAALWSVFTLVSCIDEDTSDCGKDYTLTYRMNLKVNLTTVLDEELDASADADVRPVVENALSSLFRAYATDNDLTFYNPQTRQLLRHEANRMDGATATYTLFMPAADYRHIALANVQAEKQVDLKQNEQADDYTLQQTTAADTVESQHMALFSARMDIAEQDFDHDMEVNLTMLNAATVVLIDRNGLMPEGVQGCVEGMATSFALNDSTYHFDRNTLVQAQHVGGSRHDVLYAVTLPSRSQTAQQRTTTSTSTADGLWHFHVVVRLNGKYTESVLHISKPLEAGQLRILKVKLMDDGRVVTDMPDVGISVKLDWQPGGEHDVDM